MKPIHIEAKTISDAWFQLVWNIMDESKYYKQTIQRGSFENEQYRRQFPGASIYIEHPEQDIVPQIPAHLGIPSPTDMNYIEDYCANYLMSGELKKDETYTYGSRIFSDMPKGGTQIDRIIKMLRDTPLTNHAVIEIATPVDLDVCIGNDGKCDPPCLRLIDFKVIPIPVKIAAYEEIINFLSVSVYFRSWDLWAGLPSNLGGIELMKQVVAQECGLENGPMYAYSAGLHIYGYQEELAKVRTMKND